MGLNKIKGNMYSDMGLTHTWNPLSGTCNHGCTYCSTNKLRRYEVIDAKYSGECRIVGKDLCNLGKGNTIFVCAQTDLFASDVPNQLILRILEHMDKFDNKYVLQTKNPAKLTWFVNNLSVFRKCIIGTTVESDIDYPEITVGVPSPFERCYVISKLDEIIDTFITIEPIMQFNLVRLLELIKMSNTKLINIGADSGNNNLPEPTSLEIHQLVNELKSIPGMKVNLKDNLKRLYDKEKI